MRRIVALAVSIAICGGVAAEPLEPVVFQLPAAKGWEFVGWVEAPSESRAFVIRTALPSANIEPEERATWKPTEYRIVVNEKSATASVLGSDA